MEFLISDNIISIKVDFDKSRNKESKIDLLKAGMAMSTQQVLIVLAIWCVPWWIFGYCYAYQRIKKEGQDKDPALLTIGGVIFLIIAPICVPWCLFLNFIDYVKFKECSITRRFSRDN